MIKEHPILFSAPMVKTILEGRKTQTRRAVKNKAALEWLELGMFTPEFTALPENGFIPYLPGDRLWVRETWALNSNLPAEEDREIHLAIWPPDKEGEPVGPFVWYKADGGKGSFAGKWRPSIFMPRWASRITLEVTEVRVERLQEISNEDIRKEGAADFGCTTHRLNFETLWDSINGKIYPWKDNPWVWVISFRRLP